MYRETSSNLNCRMHMSGEVTSVTKESEIDNGPLMFTTLQPYNS